MSAFSDQIESLLDLRDDYIQSLRFSWDKSDCSDAGIVRVLLIQTIRKHIAAQGEYADRDLIELLRFVDKISPPVNAKGTMIEINR